MFRESRNLRQVPRWKLKTVDGRIPSVGWHFYALLNSDVKFAPVPSVERAHGVKRGEVERNTTSIRQIAKIASEHVPCEYKSFLPPLFLLPAAPKETGYLSRGSGAANLKTAGKCAAENSGGSSRGNGRIRPIIQAAPFNLCANPLTFSRRTLRAACKDAFGALRERGNAGTSPIPALPGQEGGFEHRFGDSAGDSERREGEACRGRK